MYLVYFFQWCFRGDCVANDTAPPANGKIYANKQLLNSLHNDIFQ